jgi:hypothetical protein
MVITDDGYRWHAGLCRASAPCLQLSANSSQGDYIIQRIAAAIEAGHSASIETSHERLRKAQRGLSGFEICDGGRLRVR